MNPSPVARVRSDIFEPPATATGGRRRLRRRVAAVVIAIHLVAGAGWGVNKLVHSCGGLGSGVTRIGGQCVGVTGLDDNLYYFDEEIRDIQAMIASENRDVRDSGKPHVRVAILMPMTATDVSPLSMDKIRHSLEGAYVAQWRANASSDLLDPTPQIELLLANEGSDQGRWEPVVNQLARLTADEHPLVAVVGLGVSISETTMAARRLARSRLATVGAVLTADNVTDDMTADTFVMVSPSNDEYGRALAKYLTTRGDLGKATLVYDDSKDDRGQADIYVDTLREAFNKYLGSYLGDGGKRELPFVGRRDESGATPELFDTITRSICHADVDMVFYAGREKELRDAFIPSLAAYECEREGTLAILTGATGLGSLWRDSTTSALLEEGALQVVYATANDPTRWIRGEPGTPGHYAGFLNLYRQRVHGFESVSGNMERELADGYAVMHHDAMATAVMAARRAAVETRRQTPQVTDVSSRLWLLNEGYAVHGASGDLSFHPNCDGWPTGKLVPIVLYPPDPQAPPSEPHVTGTSCGPGQ